MKKSNGEGFQWILYVGSVFSSSLRAGVRVLEEEQGVAVWWLPRSYIYTLRFWMLLFLSLYSICLHLPQSIPPFPFNFPAHFPIAVPIFLSSVHLFSTFVLLSRCLFDGLWGMGFIDMYGYTHMYVENKSNRL